MPESPDEIRRQLAYERALYIYTSALEHGDLDALATILQEASHDPVLERMILETQEAYQHEDITGVMDTTAIASSSASVSGQPGERITGLSTPIRSNTLKGKAGSVQCMQTHTDEHIPAQPSIERIREHRKGWRKRTQSLLTTLIAAIIVGGFLAFFAVRAPHPSLVAGNHPTPTQIAPSGVVAAAYDGGVLVYKADNGMRLLNYSPGNAKNMATYSVAVKDHRVIFAGSGQVYAVQIDNGKLLWHATVGDPVYPQTSVKIDKDIALINDGNGNVYALRASDGKTLWHYATNGGGGLLAEVNGVVYIEKTDVQGAGWLVALHIEDGTPIWSFPTPSVSVAVAGDVIYIESLRNEQYRTLMAISIKDGHQFWQQNVIDPGGNHLEVDQGVVILDTHDKLCGYRTSDGKQLWCSTDNAVSSSANTSTYAIVKDMIYTSYVLEDSGTIQIEARDVHHGSLRWRWSPNTVSLSSNIAALDQNIYVTTDRTLYALRASDGKKLWSTNVSGFLSKVATAY